MLFCDASFVFIFLPLCLLFYRVAGQRVKNVVLLVSSIVFYASNDLKNLPLFIGIVTSNYMLTFLMVKSRCHSKLWFVSAIALNVGILAFFKYVPLFFEKIPFPVGISFFLFQIISYVCDIYMKKSKPCSYFDFSLYITMFPQLIAGPIVKYGDVANDISERSPALTEGIERFVFGLAKKMLLANYSGLIWTQYLSKANAGTLDAVMGILGFTFQIYFDFSAYSDMAIGIGKMFGFTFPENFDYPYTSVSIKDFWRRWHITLSSFFKEYVYIPLGGNRKSRARTALNLLIVWLLTGLWHGGSLNFVVWGIYFYIIIMFENSHLYKKSFGKLPNCIRRILTFTAICISWIIFACESFQLADFTLKSLFTPRLSSLTLFDASSNILFFSICFVFSTKIPKKLYERSDYFKGGICLTVFFISVCYIAGTSYNPFLYFRF